MAIDIAATCHGHSAIDFLKAFYGSVLYCLTGLKYASENENELKDKMDFVENEAPRHFPGGGKVVDMRCLHV